MEPTVNQQRIQVIDSLRGFALIGLPFVNIILLWSMNLNLSATERDVLVQRFLYVFVEGRFFAIFSFLFGLGLWIFLSRARQRESKPYRLFLRRLIILAAVGAVHQIFQPGEALLIYAILGFPLLLFERLPMFVNLILGTIGIILGSIVANKMLLVLPFMLLGLAFGQARIFERVASRKRIWLAVLLLSMIAFLITSVYLWQAAPETGYVSYLGKTELSEEEMQGNMDFYDYMGLSLSFTPIFFIFYVSLLVVLASSLGKGFTLLNAFGRMAFTNYLGQTILLLVFAQVYLGQTIVSYTFATVVTVLLVVCQMIFSYYWLRYFKYGPLEWLWRCGTYGRLLPIKG